MPGLKLISATLASLTLAMLILWMAGFFSETVDPTPIEPDIFEIEDDHLHTVVSGTIATRESIPGTTVARDETIISSRLLAGIRQLHVRAGDTVERGQLLIELEHEDLAARVNQAKDRVKAATARAEDAKLKLNRVTELATKQLAASADVDAATAAFASLTAQLDQANQALKETEVILSYSSITAPISGRIVERLAEPGDTVAPAQPLLLLYDPLSIRVEAPIRESLALSLTTGQAITTVIDATGQALEGHIEEIVPAAETASRSFLIKASIGYNPGLMPGMFARLQIPSATGSRVLLPNRLVTEVGELNLVFLYRDARIERRYIRLGRISGNEIAVTAGLRAGEVVIEPAIAMELLNSRR